MEILKYGNSLLRKKSDLIDINSEEERLFVLSSLEDMKQTMYDKRGIGLAAPQVGILKQFFIIDIDQVNKTDEDDNIIEVVPGKLFVFINPEIINLSGETISEEGCLSIPGLFEKVKRAESVRVEYYDENFIKQSLDAESLLAIAIQHENDHLYGKLFIDRLPIVRKTIIKNKLNKGKIL